MPDTDSSLQSNGQPQLNTRPLSPTLLEERPLRIMRSLFAGLFAPPAFGRLFDDRIEITGKTKHYVFLFTGITKIKTTSNIIMFNYQSKHYLIDFASRKEMNLYNPWYWYENTALQWVATMKAGATAGHGTPSAAEVYKQSANLSDGSLGDRFKREPWVVILAFVVLAIVVAETISFFS